MNNTYPTKKTMVAPGLYWRPLIPAPRSWADGVFTHRPWLRGRRTERTLKAKTLRAAKTELEDLGEAKPEGRLEDLAQLYLQAGAPDKGGRPRDEHFAAGEQRRLEQNLLPFFGKCAPSEVNVLRCVEYKKWRCRRMQGNRTGERSVDLELNTLSNVLHYAVLAEVIDVNRIANGRPRFRTKNLIRHCRESCARSGDELHSLANYLFDSYRERAVPLGFQALFEAIAGTRTIETVNLRWDAQPGDPGYIRDDAWLYVNRAKQRENEPYDCVPITPELRWVLLAAHAWCQTHYPKSPWFFPSWQTVGRQHVHATSLVSALQRSAKVVLGPDRTATSHGMRAFFVTWQRVRGESDTRIAELVGHWSGSATLIWTVYGKRLPAWAASDFKPEPATFPPAWSRFLPWVVESPSSKS